MNPASQRDNPQRRSKLLTRGLAALLLGAFAALVVLRVGPAPEIAIEPQMPGIGPRTPVVVRAAEPSRGLGRLEVELVQGERRETLAQHRFVPRPFWAFWGERVAKEEISLEVGADNVPWLAEGEATLVVTAERAATWLRRPPPQVTRLDLPVRLTPPRIEVTAEQVYIAQGGSAVVTYRVGESSARDGVEVGGHWFPGDALPGGEDGERFAFFAAPHDLDDPSAILLVAEDDLGNRAAAAFVARYLRRPLTTDTIRLSDRFMERVVPKILAASPELEERSDLLSTYLAINGELRRSNTAALVELAGRSRPSLLWRGAFLQQPNTQAMAAFAQRRTYLYDGREVDRQDHLGFDLASTRRAEVVAANRGVVLLAETFGIYGNTVVLDHGFGLLSLYAHLSSIGVEVGQEVARDGVLGRTGETGLAGGDHLHFSILVRGVQVNPLEWWDESWVEGRIAAKIGSMLEPD